MVHTYGELMDKLVKAHSSVTALLFTKTSALPMYRAFMYHSFSLIRLYRAAECAVGGNVLLLHHYGSLVFRRFNQTYRSIPSTLHKSSRIFETQMILLGGCLISFAQDKISDDEFTSTVKSFVANPEVLSGISYESQCPSASDSTSDLLSAAPLQNPTDVVHHHTQAPDFSNPPLTIIVRQLRNRVINLADSIFHRPSSGDDNVKSTHLISTSLDTSSGNKIDVYFSSILPNLQIQPNGNGFIDDSWEPVIEKPDLHMWRRLLPEKEHASENVNFEVPGTSEKSKAKYEYRLCGIFHDISALSFLEVQLNLAYRRHWDSRVVTLEYIDQINEHQEAETNACDNIRWITKFPFPFARREYVYVRRWWLEPTTMHESAPREGLSYGRYAIVFSRSSVPSPTDYDTEQRSFNEWTKKVRRQSPVLVSAYRSTLLIETHGQFDEPGMNYYLVYYDDPRFSVGDPTLGLVVGKAMDQFMEQLHDAAMKLSRYGLPVNTEAVVFHRKTSQATESTAVLSDSTPSSCSTTDSDVSLATQSKSTYPDSAFLYCAG